jgi:hypothetical protein
MGARQAGWVAYSGWMICIMLKGLICFPRMLFAQIEIQADHQKDEGREKNAAYDEI